MTPTGRGKKNQEMGEGHQLKRTGTAAREIGKKPDGKPKKATDGGRTPQCREMVLKRGEKGKGGGGGEPLRTFSPVSRVEDKTCEGTGKERREVNAPAHPTRKKAGRKKMCRV